ncbi:hypothetical protein DFR70_10950 [Nocardia tenerifensis]|uniref:DUF6294 domain-containing protein n=1 Tax=Nocardia tenerifensis TaxID=228006 RepID=A0A318JW91_9NOCA|nr:DUF6294 family protein [Nocardia tenerifensis]PXX60859.1 hypothetical protein DFR70_10950 [Nocardia tenerifensis]
MAVSLPRTLAGLATAAILAATATVGAAADARADTPSKRFTWDHDIHAGDCTMFRGASWLVVADGTAIFDGRVTSGSNNDAWLMHAQLFGANGKYLGNIIAQQPGVDDIGRFVKNLPDKRRQEPWHIEATYNVGRRGPNGISVVFTELERINLQSHC